MPPSLSSSHVVDNHMWTCWDAGSEAPSAAPLEAKTHKQLTALCIALGIGAPRTRGTKDELIDLIRQAQHAAAHGGCQVAGHAVCGAEENGALRGQDSRMPFVCALLSWPCVCTLLSWIWVDF